MSARAQRVARALALAGLLGVGAVVAVLFLPPETFVDPARFARPHDSFGVVDRHGAPIKHARVDGIDRRWVPLAEISPAVIDAFLAAEDARFREHAGVDARAGLRAAWSLVRPWGRRSGGSTITQQLVKRVYGRPHGVASKAGEMVRAVAAERILGKDEILEQYLNRVPFGDGIEGVGRAAEAYFGRPASELD